MYFINLKKSLQNPDRQSRGGRRIIRAYRGFEGDQELRSDFFAFMCGLVIL